MRLTLRTLLAYLDDTLDPTQARQIGQKVAESEVATELVELIRKAVRKRSLTVPLATGPERADANTVAEYLDNDLSAEKVEEVEKQALNSEVHLAEIAACHQLLTIILSEPAQVPPTARQRMYALAKGPEVDTSRKAPRVASATLTPEIPLADEGDYSPMVSRRGGSKRLAAAGILFLLLIGAVLMTLWRKDGAPPQPLPVANVAPSNSPIEADKPKEAEKPTEAPKESEKPKESDKPKESPKDGDKPKETDKPKEPVKPVDPPPPTVDLNTERKTSEDRKEVGKFATQNGLLFVSVHPGAPWKRVASGGSITGASRLMSLPATQADVRLNDAIQLDVWGAPFEAIMPQPFSPPTWPLLESVATVFAPPAGFDADLRLEWGRVYLRAVKPTGGKARIRLNDDLFDLRFTDDQSDVMIETSGTTGSNPPQRSGIVAVLRGKVGIRVNMKPELSLAMPGPAQLNWIEQIGPIDAIVDLKEPAALWAKQLPARGAARDKTEMDALSKRIVRAFDDPKKDLKLATAELSSDRGWVKVLAIYHQGAFDDLPPLLDAIDDAQAVEARPASVYALQQWLAREPGRDARLTEAFMKQKNFTDSQAKQAVALLRGFDIVTARNPETLATVIDCMQFDRLALRELAGWQLRWLDPEASEKIPFQATDPIDRRNRAVQEWKKRLPASGGSAGKSR